jgi:hypothetical protein
MKKQPTDTWREITGYPTRMWFPALFSTFAFAGYFSDLLRPQVPDWAAVALFIAPIVLILFVRWGELPKRTVATIHLVAAALFFLFAGAMEIGMALGHEPELSTLYRIFAHAGWTFAWTPIFRRAWKSRRNKGNPTG